MSDETNQTGGTPVNPDAGTTEQEIRQNDIPFAIEDIMHNAYLQYSLSVNIGRAIPDVRDGLKVGNRRILFAMRQLGFFKNHTYEKCAKVVGEVIGNYHPHGDMAVYDTLVRMAQDFSMRAPLIDGHGNFGTIDGDQPAAYRYTECRMERLAEELLADLDKDTVDMRPTFDEKALEPSVLPARFPNLLVNGTSGIGVGMATSIPPHNLGETIDATIAIINNPTITIRELMRFMPGPDFPTGGIIMGIHPIISLYENGRGTIKLRGKTQIEENDGRERIIVTEIPYGVNKEQMVAKIAELVNEKRITGISDVKDLTSDRVGIRIIIDIKRGAIASVVLNQLFNLTPLMTTIGCQFLVVDRNRPRTLNLKQVLEAYIDHREEVITRRMNYELNEALKRQHIVDGLMIAQANIDEVVYIIRHSPNRDEATRQLIARFQLDEIQAKAILEMRLYQLTNLAVDELTAEHDKLAAKIAELQDILASREKIMNVVKKELMEVKAKYADQRRTLIVANEHEVDKEDLIAREICVIPVSASSYVKRVSLDNYNAQARGGIGVRGMKTKDEDYAKILLTCCTHDLILFFSSLGKVYVMKAYDIPEGSRDGQGKAIVNLLRMEHTEQVRAMIPVPALDAEGLYVVMGTRKGLIKRMHLRIFRNLTSRGMRAITLADGDDLMDVQLTHGGQEILVSSAAGMACRFLEKEIRCSGRTSMGVKSMALTGRAGTTSEIVAMTIVEPRDELIVITANGFGMRTIIGTGITENEPLNLNTTQQIDSDDNLSLENAPAPDDNTTTTAATTDSAQPQPPTDDDSNTETDELPEEDSDQDDTTEINDLTRRTGYRRTHRGAKGVKSIRLREGDRVVAAMQISPDDNPELLIITTHGQMTRIHVRDVRLTARGTRGVIVMRLREGDFVASATVIDELSADEIAANQAKREELDRLAAQEAAFKKLFAKDNPNAKKDEDDEDEDDVEGVEGVEGDKGKDSEKGTANEGNQDDKPVSSTPDENETDNNTPATPNTPDTPDTLATPDAGEPPVPPQQ